MQLAVNECQNENAVEAVLFAADSAISSHGVGLEINEPPLLSANSDLLLSAGMTLALELHAMEPQAYTAKLEDTLHITKMGAEFLTLSPRILIEV